MKNRTCLLAWTITALALTASQSLAQSIYEPYTFTTLVGNAAPFSADGTGSAARFYTPYGVAVDRADNAYVANTGNGTIRKVTPAGVVTTLSGLTGSAIAVDIADNLYLAVGNSIQKATLVGTNWMVTTLAGLAGTFGNADGAGSAARFNDASGVAVDSAGDVYVADSSNHTIRKVTPAGVVTTLAGLPVSVGSTDGTGSDARFNFPNGVAVDSAGEVYVADTFNQTIRKVTPMGEVRTLAGLAGSIAGPAGVAVDGTGNVYVADSSNNTIRKVTPAGVVTTLAGLAQVDAQGNWVDDSSGSMDGTGSAARFRYPSGVAVDSTGNVYVADTVNSTIRKVTPAGIVTTLAGLAQLDQFGNTVAGTADGTGSAARFNWPIGVAVDSAGNVYVADSGNNTIRKVTPAGVVTTLAGLAQFDVDGYPVGGSADGTGSDARFSYPTGVAVDSAGNIYVADSGNFTIRKVTVAGVVTTLAGLAGSFGSADGTGSAARFGQCIFVLHTCGLPTGVAVDSAGNVYVADSRNSTIRKVTSEGAVTTLAGLAVFRFSGAECMGARPDGTGSAARFDTPKGVAVDSAGNLYVADTCASTIRKGYPAAPRILNSGSGFGFNGGQFGFNLTGPSGRSVIVESSSDLLNWLPLWTNTFTFPAALNFSDSQRGVSSYRFYRTRLP